MMHTSGEELLAVERSAEKVKISKQSSSGWEMHNNIKDRFICHSIELFITLRISLCNLRCFHFLIRFVPLCSVKNIGRASSKAISIRKPFSWGYGTALCVRSNASTTMIGEQRRDFHYVFYMCAIVPSKAP